jgi:hypothetical protein
MINVQKMILTMLNDDELLKSGFKRCGTVRGLKDGEGLERR